MIGRFRTAPADRRSVSFVWSGDTAGQGWGIDEARGGMRIYATMRKNRPDFFIHSGDTIYADAPIAAEVKLPDGTLWKNIVTEEKSKPAETLAEFRGNFKYNLLDKNLLAFNAEVPMFAQWDDHEVTNNWWPGEDADRRRAPPTQYQDKNGWRSRRARAAPSTNICRSARRRPKPAASIARLPTARCSTCSCSTCAAIAARTAKARRRRYGPAAYFLGPQQVAWLKRELKASRATWKVIAADMPLGLIVYRRLRRKWGVEAVAQGMDGPPRGRELEIADLLAFIKHAGVRNTVWLTADVHYTAAHYYDPNKAAFQDFEPFWEFVSGPIHAGCFGPNELDNTFGPQLMYVKAPTKEQGMNLSPATGPAVLRPRGDRRRDRRDDGDAQGHRRSGAVVDQPRTEVTAVSGVRRCRPLPDIVMACRAWTSADRTNADVTSAPPTRMRVGVFILFHS